jgi:hypothetical protein
MPLAVSKIALQQSITQAFLTINNSGAADGSDPESNIRVLAAALTDAIHQYITSANVDITQVISTVPPGTPVSTVGSPVAQSGATIAPSVATHAGFGRLI